MPKTKPKTKLKPCPWCKERPEVSRWLNEDSKPRYMVECMNDNCPVHTRTQIYAKQSGAIAAWDRRKA